MGHISPAKKSLSLPGLLVPLPSSAFHFLGLGKIRTEHKNEGPSSNISQRRRVFFRLPSIIDIGFIMLVLYLDPHSGSNFCLFKKICLNQGLSLKTACGQKSFFGQSGRCCKLLAKHLSCKSAVLKQCSTFQFGRESA